MKDTNKKPHRIMANIARPISGEYAGQRKEKIRFPFSFAKGQAMLQYLLSKVGGEYPYLALLKLAFFSDRYHVRKHARSVSSDEYFAFQYGPAGSQLKNILLEAPEILGDDARIKRSGRANVVLTPAARIDRNEFSISDIEAMDWALKYFARLGKRNRGQFVLSDITHAYPEWDQYARLFEQGRTVREDISYVDFLEEPRPDHPMFIKYGFVDPFERLSGKQRQDLIEELREYSCLL